ncbi:MAG TPA: radical SAM protein [Anaerolineae bacterium]|nr:radical SAM protein [Anaerolineae bacterium]
MALDKQNLYRLPWSKNDNPIGWLEVTDICNLKCLGCYRQKISGDKTLDQIKEEVLFLKRWRKVDNISIAGGEPLMHPQIMDVISFIQQQDIKPIMLTNALKLDRPTLVELKKAGLAGFTIHIDSNQGRPQWRDKTEVETNDLRQHYADLIHDVGGLYLVFNSTVYPSTEKYIPEMVQWAQRNIDRVNGMVFICFRTAPLEEEITYQVGDELIDARHLSYASESPAERDITSYEVHDLIKENNPNFDAAGYLGGTWKIDSIKWLAGAMIGNKHQMYGSIGPKTMELAQTGHHLFKGRYLAYLSDGKVGGKIFWLSAFDRKVRSAYKNFWGDVLRHPTRLFNPIYLQTIGVIQAPDIMADGTADMCDSCPDMTYWNGELVNSCRMDEYRLFGGFVTVVNREEAAQVR